MHYRTLTHAQLPDYLASEAYQRSAVLPISPIRASSYLHNPLAKPEHPVLFLAEEDGVLRGFLGTLPDSFALNGQDQQDQSMAWMSCLWVDPACRGQGVAGKLVRQAHDAWGGLLAMTEYTLPSQALYERLGLFHTLPSRPGWRAYRRPDLEGILPRRWPKLEPAAPLLRGLDKLGEGLLSLGECKPAPLDSGPVRVGRTWFQAWNPQDPALDRQLDHAVAAAMAAFVPPFAPTPAQLRWTQQHPWLREGQPDELARRYPFSSVARQFQTWLWLVSNEHGETQGVVAMLLRDGLLKVPYGLLQPETHPNGMADVLALARQLMARHQAHTLLTHHHGLDQGLVKQLAQSRKGFLHLRPSTRYYMVSNELAELWQARKADIFQVQDGAGDAAFT